MTMSAPFFFYHGTFCAKLAVAMIVMPVDVRILFEALARFAPTHKLRLVHYFKTMNHNTLKIMLSPCHQNGYISSTMIR